MIIREAVSSTSRFFTQYIYPWEGEEGGGGGGGGGGVDFRMLDSHINYSAAEVWQTSFPNLFELGTYCLTNKENFL